MPLLRRRPVQLLPLPNLDNVPQDTPVFYLKATGEVFLDYEAYAARLSFLLTRQFQCEYSGKSSLDYFTALQSEKTESKIVRERFPDPLKGRVLASVQFRVMGRLDSLVDLVFDRYKDRYFAGEKVFVDLSGDKYFARINRVFPPPNVRANADAAASTSAAPEPDYNTFAHKVGVDLNVEAKQARANDDPDEYLYTLQLMDEEHKFEGSSMEVRAKALSRDRLAFSKSILKRYLRECLMREAAIGAPWIVKPSIARAFNIPVQQSGTIEERNRAAREAKLAKRRKPLAEGESPAPAPKKRKTAPTEPKPAAAPATPKVPAEPKKAVKYPIEDLELDPMSIIDGRILRRVNAELPSLPPKPQPHRDLPVPADVFDRFIETWNILNIFSKSLNLSPFTLDDYAGALKHDTTSPRCVLLTEIHASLTNIIGTDTSRVLGSTMAVTSHGGGSAGAAKADSAATPVPEDGAESVNGGGGANGEGVDELAASAGDGNDGDTTLADATDDIPYEESELNKLVRIGISYAKRWDRQAKLKYSEGRDGWEKHLIGAMCQRGGPHYLFNFVRIMRHLFAGHPKLPKPDFVDDEPVAGGGEVDEDVKPSTAEGPSVAATNGDSSASAPAPVPAPVAAAAAATGSSRAGSRRTSPQPVVVEQDPEKQYLSLPLEDKLDIIGYLCTLVMGSKAVRGYVDECDLKLTELRKTRADVNKERKSLTEQKTIADAKAAGKLDAATMNGSSGGSKAANGDAMDVESAPASEADGRSSRAPSVKPGKPVGGEGDDEDEDQLVSDADSSVAPSEAGSLSAASRRQAALEEKRLEKLGGKSSGRSSLAGGTRAKGASLTVEDRLRVNAERDDEVEREFRRYLNVSRCRPLGKDRFHCRYWWFDGVGSMDLVSDGAPVLRDDGDNVVYGTGRLLVQGPSEEDWEVLVDQKDKGDEGAKAILARRMREEVVDDPSLLLGVNEWACYDDDETIETLLGWLNSKGTRELALKNAITKWRPFVSAGSKKRLHDLANPELPRYEAQVTSGRRSSRKVEYQPNTYLGWQNQNPKFV
ncbi:hypothetical protein JCM3775_005332 [Rhodotorula graminis]|uniref:WAC domain-containing protein n=1 Tax=Rhodotorula graminis (strain WP1) TaxID=578459 RepID=A0A0N8Q022_RHOGW|nr:uncharacterized protein RHOBADRAFT_54504 [Rhodotorula graminis WP1]KPV73917.1 hypothetical protein RHOBADRAFT_54504 [Rhodotorula graminis WP1]